MLEKTFKKCDITRFALRDFLTLRSEPMSFLFCERSGARVIPRTFRHIFVAPKFISSQSFAKYFAFQSTLLFMNGPPCFCAPELILS